MKNLSYRALSAIVAALLFAGAVYLGNKTSVYIMCLLTVVRGSFEIARMIFSEHYPKFSKNFFIVLTMLLFLLITQDQTKYLANFMLIICFLAVAGAAVIFHRSFKDLEQIFIYVAKNCFGFIYICFLPATVAWTLDTNNGMEWFFCLLGVVFAGDIGAYIFGSMIGKHKIAPLLSPKKTLEGALGGLLFSLIFALSFKFVMPGVPFSILAICGLLGGLLGQLGDFFESLVKRVSGVKDSGSIMPGHGGILDRLDGVLFAAPLFYFVATCFSL